MFYRKKRKNLIWIAIILIAVVFLNFSIFKTTPILRFSRNLAIGIIYPFQYAASATFNGIRSFFSNIIFLRIAQKENESLKKELLSCRARLSSFQELMGENERLKVSLRHKASSSFKYSLLHAEVISRSASNWFNEIRINRGKADGLRPDLAVIASEGLVGRVVEVTNNSSKVLLITDPASSVSAVDQRSRRLGIVIGGAIGPLSMKYVSTSADMKLGDIVVTSGMSEVFPRGIPIGRILSVSKKDYDLFQKITLSPTVDFSKLETVFVVIK
ncbi:rod shape-determining protein MreC [Candidatus Margulisiibacteriota bacterium]